MGDMPPFRGTDLDPASRRTQHGTQPGVRVSRYDVTRTVHKVLRRPDRENSRAVDWVRLH